MRGLLRLLNYNRWPLWFRMIVAFVLMILVPTMIAFVVIENEVRAVDRENLTAYLSERGIDQRESISDDLSRVRAEMRNFAEKTDQRVYLLRLLSFNSSAEDVTDSLLLYMNERMVGSGYFDGVRLVNVSGEVVLSSGVLVLGESIAFAQIGDDESATSAYRAYIAALELDEDQRWVLNQSSDGQVEIEIIQVVSNADGAVGYIAGSVNESAVVFDVLQGQGVFIDSLSYLVTTNGGYIGSQEDRIAIQAAYPNAPVSEALAQEIGEAEFKIGDESYVAFYAPIRDAPFGLIVQTPLRVNFVATLDRIYNQGILLVIGLMVFAGLVGIVMTQSIVPPLQSLQNDILALGEGDFRSAIRTIKRGDEIGSLARTFATVREQIRSVVEDQASRIAMRVRDLQATQEVNRFAASQSDLQTLMDRVVESIVAFFPNIYHAQIFLLDSERRDAVLRASTGEAGRKLLDRGHRLAVGSVSVIGQVTEEGRPIAARDTGASQVHRRNEFLPETRAELAIPLRVGDDIIGALDVQSVVSNSFTEDQMSILQTMADQIAIAIENTRLYEESVRRLEEIERANRESTRQAWREHLNTQRQRALVSQAGTYRITDEHVDLRAIAVTQGRPAIGDVTMRDTVPFAVPIILRGQVLGAVEWEVPAAHFSEEKIQLAQELVNRLSLSLDNARLFQSSQRVISRERLVNEIAAKLTGQTNIEEILQTAVREVGQALRAPQVQVNLTLKPSADDVADERNGNG